MGRRLLNVQPGRCWTRSGLATEAAARLSLPVNRHARAPGDTRPSSLGPTVGRPPRRNGRSRPFGHSSGRRRPDRPAMTSDTVAWAGRWAGLKPERGRPTRIDPALLRGAGRRSGERSRLKGHADFEEARAILTRQNYVCGALARFSSSSPDVLACVSTC